MIYERQWTIHQGEANHTDIVIAESELDDRDIVLQFLSGDIMISVDITKEELISIRNELTAVILEALKDET